MNEKQFLILGPVLAAAALALAAPSALSKNQGSAGYRVSPSSQDVWKKTAGQCWRAGYWTPAHAIMECVTGTEPVRQKRQR